MITSKNRFILILHGLFLSFIINSCSFSSKTTKKLFNKALAKTYDVIIVPGVPFENLQWSRTMKGRVYWSKYLYDKGIAKNIMYSGSSVYTPYYEAMIMAQYGEAIGIPKKNIFTETKAEHSTENLYYSYYKSKKLGFNKIALATDPFQSKQLRSFVKNKLHNDVTIIPFVIDTLKVIEPTMTDPKIDQQKAYNKDFASIKKREGWWKRFKGTMGWNIDKKAYK